MVKTRGIGGAKYSDNVSDCEEQSISQLFEIECLLLGERFKFCKVVPLKKRDATIEGTISMAGFKTHITTSTVIGIGYAAGAHLGFQVDLEHCMIAGGLCSVAGMLPDLDSDSGIPVRETISFAAAVVPMLMIDRFRALGLSHSQMALAGMLIYILIRFGVAEIFKRYTVHRGMWHSIPAAATAGLLTFLICADDDIRLRIYKASAVVIGFLSHLILDEIYSIDMSKGVPRLKKSFGTALKFWSHRSLWANISTYAKLVILIGFAVSDPILMDAFGYESSEVVPHTATELWNELVQESETLVR